MLRHRRNSLTARVRGRRRVPVAAAAGAAGLLAQLGLTAAFRASAGDSGRGAGVHAHQVALLLMLFVSVFGLVGRLAPPASAATAGRLLAPANSARWLGALCLGMLVAWDIPTCLVVPKLRKPDLLAHHFGMAAVALVGAFFLPTRYGFYYLGVAELSSVPMTVFDQAEHAVEIAAKSDAVDAARRQRLRATRDASRLVAALVFIAVRAVDFTRVTLTRFVPDALSVLASGEAALRWPLQFMVVSSVGFVGLQLYWLSLFVRISLAQRRRERRRAR